MRDRARWRSPQQLLTPEKLSYFLVVHLIICTCCASVAGFDSFRLDIVHVWIVEARETIGDQDHTQPPCDAPSNRSVFCFSLRVRLGLACHSLVLLLWLARPGKLELT